jgi:hypothetical protein
MKPHLFFRNPVEGVAKYKQPKRNPGIQDTDDKEKNYDPRKEDYIRCRDLFHADRETRIRNRNLALNIPVHIEYIEIHFFDSFNSGTFENFYRNRFGLAPVVFKEFNSVGVFAVIDSDRFNRFLKQFELFINTDNHIDNVSYDKLIKFIKEFYFLTTERIMEFSDLRSYVILNILKNPEFYRSHTNPIETRLREYLTENEIEFFIDNENERIELINIQRASLLEIINNFDIIHTVNSYSAGIIRPSEFNTPIREFGFSISNSDEDLPLIGIIDTGISSATPLASLIINDGNEFDLTGTSPTLDEANHGTAVASLATLGRNLIPDHIGKFEADAKLLSMKVMTGTSRVIKISDIETLIRDAHSKYKCKIFTLTILFEQPLKDNANISEYACMLDKLVDELNILIFISAGNAEVVQNTIPPQPVEYPYHFPEENMNICSPADSLNNLVVGAISDNFEANGPLVLASDSTFPASYTRRFNLGVHHVLKNSRRKSKHLFKPDIALPGGDYDNKVSAENTGIKVISAQTGIFFDRRAGTSLSAPLAANLAAKLLRIYPSIGNNMQSVKALIVNSSSIPNFGEVFKTARFDPQKLIGKGIADNYQCLYSDENSITLLLEDTIRPSDLEEYLLNTPEYLHDLPHKRGVIEITATLCYKIRPIPEVHISYCPVCISFGFFNNKVINNEQSNEIKLKSSITWSEDYYFATKLLSNCQKISFRLDKVPLDRENNTLKIAVNCKTHKLLNQNQKDSLNYDMPFSLAINIREIPEKGNLSGNLYAELEAINTLESMATLDATLENMV